MIIKKSILTVSVGKEYYHQLTQNLISSFLIHNKSDIKINVLTDNTDAFVNFAKNSQVIIQDLCIDKEDKSFTSKFYMYEKAIAEENLFIDCDCLVYQDLSSVFEAFEGRNFSALGSMQIKGDFFCDISKIISKFNIPSLPVFVGSVYYFKKNEIVKNIFAKALELKTAYDELGFIRLRGKENEEPLVAVAMAINGEECLKNPHIKADAMFYKNINANIIKGNNKIKLLDNSSKAQYIYSNISTTNIPIIHFNASFSDGWNYRLEAFRLGKYKYYGIFTNIIGFLTIRYPAQIETIFKNNFRPLYRRIIGIRSIKKSNRI